MEPIPIECLRERLSLEQLRELGEAAPEMVSLVEEFAAAAQPCDEFWLYDIGNYTGLALVRSGAIVKSDTFMHAYVAPPELVIRWVGPPPSNREILALRQIDPSLREKTIPQVKEMVGGYDHWPAGHYPRTEVEAMTQRCRDLGLRFEWR